MGRAMAAVGIALALTALGACKTTCVGPKGERVEDGAGVRAADGCNQCTCLDGDLVCTTMACKAVPVGTR